MQFFKNKNTKIISFIIVITITILFIFSQITTRNFGIFRHIGNSMMPTLQHGKYVITDKLIYKFRPPKRLEVVVVEPQTQEKGTFFIKRIIGLPGETIRISDGKVFIKTKNSENFTELEENYLLEKNSTHFFENYSETDFVIPENHYWIMGDNRMNSSDSRNCFRYPDCTKNEEHFLNKENIYGLVRF